jgi:KDO2-lipid IV(A) lauroyltransferase
VGRRYPVRGWQILEDALAEGRGAIIVSAHVGALSAAGNLAPLHNVPTTVLVEQLDPPQLHDYISRLRGAIGMRMVPADRRAARAAIEALRKGELVGIMCDRDVAGTGELLPFFGNITRVTTAAATLARRTDAIIVTCVAYRSGLLRGVGAVYGPVTVPRTNLPGEDIRNGTLEIISYLELFIRAHPEQWVVFEDLWPCGTMPPADDDEAVL